MSAIRNIVILLWALLLSACTIQLAPGYDQALVEGLDATNTEALTLLASVEDGSPVTEFGEYADDYAQVIGQFDALRQRAENRQIPPLAKRISKLGIVRDFCNSASDPTGCINASPASLKSVLELLRRMRTQHRTRGLAPDTVELFRTGYDTAISQALTVETALRR